MRILVDATPVKVGGGGICTFLAGLLRGWTAAGFNDEWHIVGSRSLPEETEALVPAVGRIDRIGRGGQAGKHLLQQVYVPLSARRSAQRPDVILCTTPVIPMVSVSVPIVAFVHDLRHASQPFEYSLLQRLYRRKAYVHGLIHADAAIAISDATCRSAERETRGQRRFEVVLLGADHVDTWRSDSPLSGHGVAFAHWPNKRPDIAIRAWGMLLDRRRSFDRTLHVLGCPPSGTASLERLAHMHGVSHLVRVHGFLPEDEYRDLFSSASIVLMPSSLEGFGLPVVEAMRLGIPVVASDDPAMREAGGDHALYAPVGSAECVARHCETVLNCGDRRTALVAGGLKHSRSFTWERTARAVRGVLSRAIEEYSGRARSERLQWRL